MILINKEQLLDAVMKKSYSQASIQLINDQPEVEAIPLDKPFCKMVYGDYVVYNKKWLVNHLQTEWNILQGKEYKPAIPVEWFEWLLDTMGDGMYNLRAVIKDWERYKEEWGERK